MKRDAYHQNPSFWEIMEAFPNSVFSKKATQCKQRNKKIHRLQDVNTAYLTHEYLTVPESIGGTNLCYTVYKQCFKLSLLLMVENFLATGKKAQLY